MPGTGLPKPACIPVMACDHRPGVSLAPQVPDPVLSPDQPLRTRSDTDPRPIHSLVRSFRRER